MQTEQDGPLFGYNSQGRFEVFYAQYGDWYEGDGPNLEGYYWIAPSCEEGGDSCGPYNTARDAYQDALKHK